MKADEIPQPRTKVIIEKFHGGRFFREQELRFGLNLGRLALLKKKYFGKL